MLVTEHKQGIFRTKEIWFAPHPFNVDDCAAVTFRACGEQVGVDGFVMSKYPTLTLDLVRPSCDIWKGMDKKSCRYEVKRAIREGISVIQGQSHADFAEFCVLNDEYRASRGWPKTVGLDYVRRFGTLFWAQLGGQRLAAQVYLEDEKNIRWLLAAATGQSPLVSAANRLLVWYAIEYAYRKHITTFDFGGIALDRPELSGVNFFKQSFGGTPTTHYIYHKVYNPMYGAAAKIHDWIAR